MTPELIVFGIRASLRAAQAGADLYSERARDRPVFLPDLEFPEGGVRRQLIRFLLETGGIVGRPELVAVWDADAQLIRPETSDAALEEAYRVMVSVRAEALLARDRLVPAAHVAEEAQRISAGRMIEQWRRDRRPPSALARMALTLTDIGLEYVAADPSLFGASSSGEKLIVAFAEQLAAMIPDGVDEFGVEAEFADRVLGIVLRAGLGTLSEHPGIAFRDEHVARLVSGVAKPLVDALPANIVDQMEYRALVDSIAGPAAKAAFGLLAEDTATWLGDDFAGDEPMGIVTAALFRQVASTAGSGSVRDVFTEEGALALYRAGLTVAVERPGVFVGDAGDQTRFFEELLGGAAVALRDDKRLAGSLGAELAALAVRTAGDHAATLLDLDPGRPWEHVAERLIAQLAEGLGSRIERGAFARLSDDELYVLGSIILEEVARAPGMLDADSVEVQAIVSGIAEVMAADNTLLLSPGEWLVIASTAARIASANPGRLFGLEAEGAAQSLGRRVISSVLGVAATEWQQAGGRASGHPLVGATLARALALVVEGLAGNVRGVRNDPDSVKHFFESILALAKADPDRLGSAGVLRVVDALIGKVLAEGTVPSANEIEGALA